MKTETMKKKTLRVLVSSFLTLILALTVVLLGLLPTMHTLSSSECWVEILDRIGYADKIREKLLKEFSYLSETSGVPESVYSAFLEEEIGNDTIYAPILGMFSREGYRFEKDRLVEAFSKKVEQHAAAMQEAGELKLNEKEWEEMQKDFPNLAKYYVSEVNQAINMGEIYVALGGTLRFLENLIVPVAAGAGIFAVFAFVLLLLIHKNKIFIFGYLGFFSAGILLTLPAVWLKVGKYVPRLGIEPLYLKNMIVAHNDALTENLLLMGISYLAVGLVFGILAILFSRTVKKTKEEKNDPNPSQCDA